MQLETTMRRCSCAMIRQKAQVSAIWQRQGTESTYVNARGASDVLIGRMHDCRTGICIASLSLSHLRRWRLFGQWPTPERRGVELRLRRPTCCTQWRRRR